ncbi:rare lipoprotein A (peptidoglycan hydrolase) [Bradyrhizobium japonicum USDA 38]|uniref:septal ring lytic transglycosylase RlpA family protein n=1 Tax=Bradyrhizobium japonicum TaxID=375 RepID=UPI0004191C8B|nr:septal ring lytic transglycosylase RlpA family protein [Bradyrhizobium japonicum]MCS3896743.1 rare lipoprotein A (peptidoglycan hydrolase) [Bradyrhizobium japonicum USDA 38]MCS3949258.1 rare lipoprotein A (peptidoglycan hydrolase) [Bradyrhizobium japonicum]
MKRWSGQPALLAATAIVASCIALDGGIESAHAKFSRITKSATIPGATPPEVHDHTRDANGSPTANDLPSIATKSPRQRQRAAGQGPKAHGDIRRATHRKSKPQHAFHKRHHRRHTPLSGLASFYSEDQMTASGERFNKHALHAAHPSLPFGTRLRVTNVLNGKSVIVRVNDRGPFVHGRIIDVTSGAAQALGMIRIGVVNVTLEIVR